MNSPKEFAEFFIKNQEIYEKVKTVIELKQQMQMQLANFEQLHWTISQTRNYLREKLLAQDQFKKMPKALYEKAKVKVEDKLDTLFPISFADYRQLNQWQDVRSLADFIYEGHDGFESMKRWYFDKTLCEYKTEFEIKKQINQEIARNQPLTLDEFKDMERRIIYAQCGGVDNIENINVITNTFLFQEQQIEEKFLEIKLKNLVKYKGKDYILSNSHLMIVEYYDYNLNLSAHGIMRANPEIPQPWSIHGRDVFNFIHDKFENNRICLIWIKNNEDILPDIDNFIAQLENDRNKLENKSLRKIVNDEFKNIKAMDFYDNCCQQILPLTSIQNRIKEITDEIIDNFWNVQEFSHVASQQYNHAESEFCDNLFYYGKIKIFENQLKTLDSTKENLIAELAALRNQTNKIKLSLKTKTSAVNLLKVELEKAQAQGAVPKTKFNFENQENDDTDAKITKIINNIKAIEKEQQEILTKLVKMTENQDHEKYLMFKDQQEILRKTKYCPGPESSTSEKLKTATLNLKEKMTKLLKNKKEKKVEDSEKTEKVKNKDKKQKEKQKK